MSEFNFTCVDEEGATTSLTFNNRDTWVEVLDKFVQFLRGTGYQISNESIAVNLQQHPFADELYTENLITFCSSNIQQPCNGQCC